MECCKSPCSFIGFIDFQGAAALDPLHLATPPANNGPQGFMGFAAILMASVASIAIVAKKFIAKAQAPLDPMDLFQNERVAMATIAMAPSKKTPFSKRREALEGTYEAKKPYSVDEALDLVKSSATGKFDETIDVATRLNVDPRKADQMLRGAIVMPGGTGKNVRVAAFCSAENEAAAKEAGADFYGLYNNLLAAKPTTVKGVYVKNFVISSTVGVGISVDPTTFAPNCIPPYRVPIAILNTEEQR